jgi:hypothetical protein
MTQPVDATVARGRTVKSAVLCLFFLVAGFVGANSISGESHSSSAPADQIGPTAVLRTFYHWYLTELINDRNPMHDDRSKMETYVSKALLTEIDRRSESPNGLDEDYFIKAQDYLEDWESNVRVSDVHIEDNVATAVVTLGAAKESQHPLALSLTRDGMSWKISKVAPSVRH